jgi:2-(1,2-epoxy-1,2-dihydrophenyl)acetyl-CoA isomerase
MTAAALDGARPIQSGAMPDQPDASVLLTEQDGEVMTLTLNRPDALNALTSELRRALLGAIKALARDETVRTVVITGAGRGFCAGADLRGRTAEREFRRVITTEYNPLIEAIRGLEKPVIASVNGVAAGAGMSLALAADLVVAVDEARFVPAFNRIGLVPDSGLTRVLVRAVGRHRAFEILMGEQPLDAAQAHALGLVAAVVPKDQLADATQALAKRMASGPTRGMGLTKRLLNAAEDATLAENVAAEASLQEIAGRTDDHAEGVAAFTEKRDPQFRGR